MDTDSYAIWINDMHRTLQALFYLLTILIFLSSLSTAAIGTEPNQTNNCHCFRDRTFNPGNKFISDDYILTTTFNSLLASEFNISKRQIIMMKMRDGVANADLMTALFIAKESGIETTQLLQMKKTQSWQKIVKSLQEGEASQGKNAFSFIQTNKSDESIAEDISFRLITKRFSPSPDDLDTLRKNKLTARQIVLSFTLANHASIPVLKLADQFLTKGYSWSEIAHNLGLQPADTGKLLENTSQKK